MKSSQSNRRASVCNALLVIRHDDKFLLMFNKWKKYWELPGGIIDEGETARECAVRELLEETNQYFIALGEEWVFGS